MQEKKTTECDTLRRGEISERKGNIKRCCWHRSVHSFGFYFTVRLAAEAAKNEKENECDFCAKQQKKSVQVFFYDH